MRIMSKKVEFEVARVLHNGMMISIVKTQDYHLARDVFGDELGHFDELRHDETLTSYSVLKVVLKKDGSIIEEHIKYYDGQESLM